MSEAEKGDAEGRNPGRVASRLRVRADGWRRDTFALPRPDARAKARALFEKFPKQAYMTSIESWRELPGDRIEFTIRRLPTAD